MFINPVSTIAILLAIHGCLAAPVLGNERALAARDKGSPKPATVAKPAVLPAAKKEPPSTPAADTKSRPAVNKVEEPPKSAAENKPKPAAPAANKEQPKAAAAKSKSCALHKKRSWIYRRGSDSEPESECESLPESDENTLHLHAIVNKKGDLDTSKVHTVHLGDELGSGEGGSVRKVTSHGFDTNIPQVAKTLNIGGPAAMEEAKSLKKVGQLTMVGKDKDGGTHIVMDEVPGSHLKDTNAYNNAETDQDRDQVKAKANQLTGEAALHHAEEHDRYHNDLHPGNVKFTEDHEGNLQQAHLLDWGRAIPVDGANLSQGDKDAIKDVNMNWRGL